MPNIWANFVRKICLQDYSKVAQSGHTAHEFDDDDDDDDDGADNDDIDAVADDDDDCWWSWARRHEFADDDYPFSQAILSSYSLRISKILLQFLMCKLEKKLFLQHVGTGKRTFELQKNHCNLENSVKKKQCCLIKNLGANRLIFQFNWLQIWLAAENGTTYPPIMTRDTGYKNWPGREISLSFQFLISMVIIIIL